MLTLFRIYPSKSPSTFVHNGDKMWMDYSNSSSSSRRIPYWPTSGNLDFSYEGQEFALFGQQLKSLLMTGKFLFECCKHEVDMTLRLSFLPKTSGTMLIVIIKKTVRARIKNVLPWKNVTCGTDKLFIPYKDRTEIFLLLSCLFNFFFLFIVIEINQV